MSQETELKRKKLRTAMFLLITVVALYLVVIVKQW
jgi:predicted nucleic acid-binding Zn ribbon protein